LSKNRIIVENDKSGGVNSQVTSSTSTKKSHTNIYAQNGKYFLNHNIFSKVKVILLFC